MSLNQQTRIQALENEKQVLKVKFDELENTHSTYVGWASGEIESMGAQLVAKDNEINKKELKKLSEAYADEEANNKKTVTTWMFFVVVVFVLLIVSSWVSVSLSHTKIWYERFEYYVADLILLSFLWFCASQYTDAVRLRNDYANRKTIAQSFNNILNSLEDNQDIKNKFIEKTTDILCAPAYASTKEPVLSKAAITQIIDLAKTIKS
jgi:hypothetical protein